MTEELINKIATINCDDEERKEIYLACRKQIPKTVYNFVDYDEFETTCCGINISNQDYKYCPECGCLLGEVEEVRGEPNDN